MFVLYLSVAIVSGVVIICGLLVFGLMSTAGHVSRLEEAGLLAMPELHTVRTPSNTSSASVPNPAQVLTLADQGLASGFLSGGAVVNTLIDSDTYFDLPHAWPMIDQDVVTALVVRFADDVHLLVRKHDVPPAAWQALLAVTDCEDTSRHQAVVAAWRDLDNDWHETADADLLSADEAQI